MQVDGSKPVLIALMVQRLELECDEPLSKFSYSFNLRRYNVDKMAALCVRHNVPLSQTGSFFQEFGTFVKGMSRHQLEGVQQNLPEYVESVSAETSETMSVGTD